MLDWNDESLIIIGENLIWISWYEWYIILLYRSRLIQRLFIKTNWESKWLDYV